MGDNFDLGQDTITRLRAPLVRSTRDNSESRDWSHAYAQDIPDCMVEPFLVANRLLMEVNDGREFEQEPQRIYVPGTTDLVYTDRVQWKGQTYDIIAAPTIWTDFDGDTPFLALMIRLRSG